MENANSNPGRGRPAAPGWDVSFEGQAILVQGGSSGVGKAAAQMLCKSGARVAITGTRQETVDAALDELRTACPGGKLWGYVLDTRDVEAARSVVAQAVKDLGRIDGYLGCAAVSGSDRAEDLGREEWDRVLDTNLLGAFNAAQAVGRVLIAQGGGAMVLVSSTDGLGGQASRTHYVTSKHGLHGLVKSLALEWGRHGVRVNAIAPSVIDTPMLRRNMPPSFLHDVMVDRCPLGRVAEAEEVAAAAMLLLTGAASYINGAILPVDGGLTTGFWTRAQGGDYSSRRLLEAGIYEERG